MAGHHREGSPTLRVIDRFVCSLDPANWATRISNEMWGRPDHLCQLAKSSTAEFVSRAVGRDPQDGLDSGRS